MSITVILTSDGEGDFAQHVYHLPGYSLIAGIFIDILFGKKPPIWEVFLYSSVFDVESFHCS